MLFCLKIVLTFKRSVDPDEMHRCAAFYLGLHICKSFRLEGSQTQRVKCLQAEYIAFKRTANKYVDDKGVLQ